MTAACALLAAALFAAALVTTQFGLRHMDGLAGAQVSIPSAAAVFWLLAPLLRVSNPATLGNWQPEAAMMFAALGLIFPVAVTLLAYEANRRMGPTVAGAIGSTAPLFAVMGAVLFLREQLTIPRIGATLAIMAGSIVLIWRGRTVPGAAWMSWVAWLAAAIRALAQVIVKAGLLLWPDPYAAVLLGYSVSALTIWIIGTCSRRPGAGRYNRRGVFWFALTGLCNCSAVFALYTALDGGSVNVVSPIAATYPLFTVLLNSIILREEHLNARRIIGVTLTVCGVVALLIL